MITPPTSYRRKRWLLPVHDAAQADRLANELKIPSLIAGLPIPRNFTDAPAALARQAGPDVIVSDHHEFPRNGELPPANAIIHPRFPIASSLSAFRIQNSEFSPYPNPDLCGAGVAFKLAWAIAQKLCNAE